jgi:nucleoside 2-deoxyribosyltransferase
VRKLIVYLSGGMRGYDWQAQVIAQCSEFDFVNPRRHGLSEPAHYTAADLLSVRQCDIVLAYMRADNPSGIGLALEVGYALALGKTVVLVNGSENKYMAIVGAAAQVQFEKLSAGIAWLRSVAAMY